MKWINLTPHAINLIVLDQEIVIPASGDVARVSVETKRIDVLDGVPISRSFYGDVEGLPEPQPGVSYIVSALVAGRCTDRSDVFIPNEAVRDDQGRIIGCRSLGIVR